MAGIGKIYDAYDNRAEWRTEMILDLTKKRIYGVLSVAGIFGLAYGVGRLTQKSKDTQSFNQSLDELITTAREEGRREGYCEGHEHGYDVGYAAGIWQEDYNGPNSAAKSLSKILNLLSEERTVVVATSREDKDVKNEKNL